MSANPSIEGGCHCGALRFRARVAPRETAYCHCRDCQRTTGAPVLVWSSFASDAFEYVAGTPAIYRSSDRAQREFCGACGAQIAFRFLGPAEEVDVNVGTFDDPAAVTPGFHTWIKSRIPWFETDDTLPRFDEEPPGGGS